MKTNMEYNK